MGRPVGAAIPTNGIIMKILAYSDLHLSEPGLSTILDAAGQADLILGVGDFAQQHDGLADYMARLEPLAAKSVYVPGNNETADALRAATSATVLHGETVTRGGLTIGGIGGAIPPLPPLPWGSYDLREEQAAQMLTGMACDIFISHSPPFGIADVHGQLGHLGSNTIRAGIERMQPRLCLCGHIHDCWGATGMIGQTPIHNLGPTPNWFEVTP